MWDRTIKQQSIKGMGRSIDADVLISCCSSSLIINHHFHFGVNKESLAILSCRTVDEQSVNSRNGWTKMTFAALVTNLVETTINSTIWKSARSPPSIELCRIANR